MSKLTNNKAIDEVETAGKARTNQNQVLQTITTQKNTIRSKVIKTNVAFNEPYDLNSNCFVLGYN